jgi:signal transduction histidine kinase
MEVSTARRRTLLHPFRGPRSDADRLQFLLAAQKAVAMERELDDVLTRALEHALVFTGLQIGAGLVQSANGERVMVRCVVGNPAQSGLDRLAAGTVARGPVKALYDTAVAGPWPLQQPVPLGELAAAGTGWPAAYLVIPLITVRQQVLGALLLSSATYQQPLAPEDVDILQALARQMTPAVESAQLHEHLERALDEVLTLHGAGQAISSSLDLQEVLDGILDVSRRLTRADCCLITGMDSSGDLAVLAECGGGSDWLAYRTTPGVRLTINAVLRDGALRPLGIPPVTGWCIGLKVRQQVIGTLEVYARSGAPRYDESHLLNGLATHAAIAIENAKLYQAVREKEFHLQDLVERMIQSQEEDRRRVAYDIHDGLAQLMVSAHQHLQTFGLLQRRQDPRAEEALAKGLFMLQKSIEEVRKVIAGLRPSELDDLGLVAAIQLYVQSLRDDFGWQLELVEEVGPERLPAAVEVTAYRIIQEALTNARRHGDAGRARVELRREQSILHLLVQDWGTGFDVAILGIRAPSEAEMDREAGQHVGLHGMRERAHLLGGTFHVESQPGEGTRVQVTLPVHEGLGSATPFPFNYGDMTEAGSAVSMVGVIAGPALGNPTDRAGEAIEAAGLFRVDVVSGGVVGGWRHAPADLTMPEWPQEQEER